MENKSLYSLPWKLKLKLSDLNNKHFLSLAGNGIIAILSIVTIGILNRTLEKSDVGIYFFFIGMYTLTDAVRYGFLSTATVKFYAGADKETGEKVLGSIWLLAIIITGMILIFNALLLPFTDVFHNEAFAISVQWFGVTILSTLPLNVIFWILTADERYDKILWLKLINNGSMILIIMLFVALHRISLQSLLAINCLTNCLASIVGLLWGLGKFRTIFKTSKERTKEIFHFGKYCVGTTLLAKLQMSTDTFIIAFLLGPADLAIYSLPVKLMEIVEFPLRSFMATGMSAMAAAYNNKNNYHASYILKKYSGMLILAFVPLTIFVFLFAEVAVSILGGAKYMGTHSANIFRLFMLLALIYPIDRFTGVGLDVVHKPKVNFLKVLTMLILTIIGNFVGVAIFKNLYGIIFSTGLALIIGTSFSYYQLQKELDFTFKDILWSGYTEMKLFIRKFI